MVMIELPEFERLDFDLWLKINVLLLYVGYLIIPIIVF